MELKDLKSAWSKYSSTDASRHQLNEDDLHTLLKKRTKNLIERIDRNVRVGFIFLLLLTLLLISLDFFVTPSIPEGDQVPAWIMVINALNTLFLLCTFIYFILSYRKTKKQYSYSNNLKNVLISIINTINTYRRLFYLALAVLLVVVSVDYITGMYAGARIAAYKQGGEIADLNQEQLLRQLIAGLLQLFGIVIVLFVFFRWGFRKLYGRYISKLKDTLRELEEIE